MGCIFTKTPLWRLLGSPYNIPTDMVGPNWNRDNMIRCIYSSRVSLVREFEKEMYNNRRAIMVHKVDGKNYWTHCGLVPYNPDDEYIYVMMLTRHENNEFVNLVMRRSDELWNSVVNPTAVQNAATGFNDCD